MYEIKFHALEDKYTIIYWYSTYLYPTSTFSEEDGQEKKSNGYKKIILRVTLCGGKWKNGKYKDDEVVNQQMRKKRKTIRKNKGFWFGKLKQRERKYRK